MIVSASMEVAAVCQELYSTAGVFETVQQSERNLIG